MAKQTILRDTESTETNGETGLVTGWCSYNLLWMSLLAVAVWPTIGIAACHHLFDDPSEAALLFGGFTACILYLPAFLVGSSDIAFMSTLIVLWLLMWLVPIGWLIKHPRNRRYQSMFIATLSSISLAQAALGYLMILGKGV